MSFQPSATAGTKAFCFFFSKKKALASAPGQPPGDASCDAGPPLPRRRNRHHVRGADAGRGGAVRPVRRRQVHGDARHRRAAACGPGAGGAGRPGAAHPAAGAARHRLRVPGGPAIPAHERGRQPALRAAPGGTGTAAVRRRGRAARHRRAAGPAAGHAVRRRAPARGDRPRAAEPAAAAADGRAALRTGPGAARGGHPLPRPPALGAAGPDRLCQPCAGRGDAPGRHAGADRGRACGGVRPAGGGGEPCRAADRRARGRGRRAARPGGGARRGAPAECHRLWRGPGVGPAAGRPARRPRAAAGAGARGDPGAGRAAHDQRQQPPDCRRGWRDGGPARPCGPGQPGAERRQHRCTGDAGRGSPAGGCGPDERCWRWSRRCL